VLALRQLVRLGRQHLATTERRLAPALLAALIAKQRQRLDDYAPRLAHAAARFRAQRELVLASLAARLDGWHQAQQNLLERGYVRVRGAAGTVLTQAAEIAAGAALTLEFHDGNVAVTATGAKRPPRESAPAPKQGRLL
jgi:exodeoxyribonuclease VII large subunit